MKPLDTDDIPTSPDTASHLNEIAATIQARRGFFRKGLGLGALGFLGSGIAACADSGSSSTDAVAFGTDATVQGTGVEAAHARHRSTFLGFEAVPANSLDTVTVPRGYAWAVVCRWGDPLFPNSPAWRGDATDSAEAQALQFGDNHDGMRFFPLLSGDSTQGLLVLNHEYLNTEFFYPADVQSGATPWSLEHVRKGQHAHGITIAEIRLVDKQWKVITDSPFNRRIHVNTPMNLTGPARGHSLMKTSADPAGVESLGTLNNCGNGYTIWGTYLTCEENFNGYFGTTAGSDQRNANQKRYGLSATRSEYRWEEHDARFDYVREPNESNRMGWIVEIDPFDPLSVPKKRTALGRLKHENAAQTLTKDLRVAVYMGDDQANEYLYKFVSDRRYYADYPMLNRDLLASGTLHVARLGTGETAGDMMGTGEWVPLVLSTPTIDGGTLGDRFADLGELLVNTRLAADAVGATPMDRPEWVTVHPDTGEGYCTLTNNSGRKQADEANPRTENVYGQIIRWREHGGDAAALAFEWDLFVLAGNPIVNPEGDLKAGSTNVTVDNTFNSPDGLAFDADGRLWIETDGNFSNTGPYEGQGNNQMLVADPVSKEIRRFLVGPSGCEITGITWTPDQRYVFVNVQHPGEYGNHPNKPAVAPDVDPLAFSKWPEAEGGRPRSATVAIWKKDGGKVGT